MPGQAEELELTFNHDGRSYEAGTGYGHVAIGVDDLDATLEALSGQGIEPEKPPYRVREGGSRLCFVRDPDGYRNRDHRALARLSRRSCASAATGERHSAEDQDEAGDRGHLERLTEEEHAVRERDRRHEVGDEDRARRAGFAEHRK